MEYSFYDFLKLLGSLALFLYGMKIMSEGLQKFCREYEKYISGAGGINYRSLIRKQVQNLKAAVMEKREYVPYRMEENHVSGEL